MKNKKFITALLGLFLLVACSPTTSVVPTPNTDLLSAAVAATLAANATPNSNPTPTAELANKEAPKPINPLTGLVVDDPSRLERRPVMVKVSNFPRLGRPH